MDLFGMDDKLSDLAEHDLNDMLDREVFTPPPSNSSLDLDLELDAGALHSDWLDNFFDDPVLNDRMMSDALQPPNVQSEHSYSASGPSSPCNMKSADIKAEVIDHADADTEFLVNPNTLQQTTPTPMMMTTTANTPTTCVLTHTIKQEPLDTEMTTVTVTRTTQPQQTLLKQPTIILATQTTAQPQTTHIKQERMVLPKVNIKVEPCDSYSVSSSPEHYTVYDNPSLPPTPPSSTGSDSEGSLSPQRSAPSSPLRGHTPYSRHHMRVSSSVSQSIFSTPIPTSGVLILTEEEKRTLISEGYPLPTKLPLTKQEEKNLKKIRRKIKNKISAQESRRKKKEYMENLEKRMEGYCQENIDLKKKMEQLESNNRSLLSQLQKLQTLVGKVARPAVPSTQTGTCLMVLVLFFAVFLGTWSPMSWNIGYGTTSSVPTVQPANHLLTPIGPQLMGPEVKDTLVDTYATDNMRSRVLLSVKDECEEDELSYGPYEPFSYRDIFSRWFSYGGPNSERSEGATGAFALETPLPRVEMLDVETENNQTGDNKVVSSTEPAALRPDISAEVVPGAMGMEGATE